MSSTRITPEISPVELRVHEARAYRAAYLGHLLALTAASLADALGRLGARLERAYEAELDRRAHGMDPYARLPIPRI